MKRNLLLSVLALVVLTVGVVAGRAFALSQEQEKNYLVVQEFEFGGGQTLNEAIEQLSEWVRIMRDTGKHSSVRLFMHEWGPKSALYIVNETNDWDAIGSLFDDLLAEIPDFPNQRWGFAGHSDNILAEIPVD